MRRNFATSRHRSRSAWLWRAPAPGSRSTAALKHVKQPVSNGSNYALDLAAAPGGLPVLSSSGSTDGSDR